MARIAILVLGILIGGALAPLPLFGHPDDEPAPPATAAPQIDPAKGALFLNMTSGDTWRGWMGLHFAHATLQMGHKVTVFLNLEAVKLAVTNIPQEKKATMQRVPHEILADFIRAGGVVLVCPPCLRELGIAGDDLVAGVQMGRPGLTQGLIFADNTRTLTW